VSRGINNAVLWFDEDIRELIGFYRGVFDDVALLSPLADVAPAGGAPEIVSIEMHGRHCDIMSVSGKPGFTEGVSFVVSCADQVEVDRYWFGLIADGGHESMCGWLKDQFGLSWQVVPTRLMELQANSEPATRIRTVVRSLKASRFRYVRSPRCHSAAELTWFPRVS